MSTLADFSITRKWPATRPDLLQLYSLPTPNGVKVSILLEELGMPYEVHKINFDSHDQTSPEFVGTFPNNKIPAIIDPNGPGGQAIALFESGAIMVYLAEKTGMFLPQDPALRYETLQWLMFQMGGIGPMFGQVGFFNIFAGKDFEDKRPLTRYVDESKRLLTVLNKHLAGKEWVAGDTYTIADMAIFPWIRNMIVRYNAEALIGWGQYPEVSRVLSHWLQRPAVQRGLLIP
ncbi:glutathione S-transferase N-terminal domain-containing protein [Comamonas piscis]|uniref:Glutathione S-transferase N-terminal domain-containing protein n=1 Tax=Comamonas piscis TaxID=1562974 RepID=A0A7G5ED70_9BURK|nr:glutathione S-transferase N-terminal domain-containing protein [Comamonas piscis]QMV71945.1 glutathione S-transferase N-terminal domain-containing protein [Comamonas piscis]WSO34688.1 glutathione S-transferase N-terminal domain-containing protein [Comamonas piscis]